MSSQRELERKVAQLVDRLPLFPHDIDSLLTMAVKPIEDNARLLRLIENEPELWTELLRLAGSFYGTPDKVETPADSVRRIGVQPLVQLIGISYARKTIQEEFSSLRYLNEYFDHSEDISAGCYILTEVCPALQGEREIYAVAGLIHDIGRLAIIAAKGMTGAHVLGTLWNKMVSVVYDERSSLDTDHCAVGKWICRKWNFSPIIQEAVLRHHSPLVDSDFSFPGALIFVVHFMSASDPSGEIISTLLATEVLDNMKLSLDDFDRARKVYMSRRKKGS